jgi:hypothetical protein
VAGRFVVTFCYTQPKGTLIKTRLLIQANSGGGKSWLIRRLAEQLFGTVPVIIIDPEGEFATLREQFGYVLVGKGGETPADARSAKLVAHKLLELQASTVCDLYEMNPAARHHWVTVFLEALVDAPKELWRPTVVIVDEAHTFCPEKGQGESEAAEAMTALATRGRKRRFCAVWATQRLAKLSKSATAELLNRLVGPTFEDVDLKRAADLLSIPSDQRRDFDKQMRTLSSGYFYAFGRALCTERTLVKVGDVQTSHEIEESQGLGPPPAPAKVRALLPQLADLPQQAEEKAKTEAELRGDIRKLTHELNEAKKSAAAAPAKGESPALKAENKNLRRLLERTMKFIIEITTRNFETASNEEIKKAIEAAVAQAMHRVEAKAEERQKQFASLKTQAQQLLHEIKKTFNDVKVEVDVRHNEPFTVAAPAPRRTPAMLGMPAPAGNGDLPEGERRILTAVAQYPEGVTREQLSILTGYKRSTRNRYVQYLEAKGFLAAGGLELVATPEGVAALGSFEPLPTGQALIDYWLRKLPEGERKIFEIVIQAYPQTVDREALDEPTGFKRSTRNRYLQYLIARRIVDPAGGGVRAAKHFFE